MAPLPRRNFLFLQGLMGPFFRRIGAALRRDGYGVYKVNFNGGDVAFWRLPNGIAYRGSLEAWPDALRAIIRRYDITDVLLFGDCRPMHVEALTVCRELHLPVHVFEEGYIRPNWVTLELGGVNGHSSLPRDPDYYRKLAASLPDPGGNVHVPSSFPRRAAEGVAYNAADILTRRWFPHWKDHRPWHPLREGVGWLKRLSRRRRAERRTQALLRQIDSFSGPMMLFPLQLDADAQVRLHSAFDGIASAIETVIGSFARHAPRNMLLVIKEHPLDNGVKDWRRLIRETAKRHRVEGRVCYMEAGDIALIIHRAKGVVTINSTTGTLALAFGIPVITLGHAVYDIPGLTNQGRLDQFWSAPGEPDRATFEAFRRVLIETCLIPGGFFSEQGLGLLVERAIERLERHSPIAFADSARHVVPEHFSTPKAVH
ncbi:capsule biosynthesis protein [Swaminathania salitolerans]|nr:capsular biosynthesis protein [Swaminathania salitolerans]